MISHTAQYLAALRAAAVEAGSAIVRDEHAHLFASPELVARMRPQASDPVLQFLLLRHRLLEDLLRAALEVSPVQVVLLGAGFDTRYQRLCVPPGTRWIEVDRPGMIQHKRRILEAAGLPMPEAIPRTIESVDDIDSILACTDPSRAALIIAENFFSYGTEGFLRETLEAIAGYYDELPLLGFDLLSPSAATEAADLCAMTPERARRLLKGVGYAPSFWGLARMRRRYVGGYSHVTPPGYVAIARDPVQVWDDCGVPPRASAAA